MKEIHQTGRIRNREKQLPGECRTISNDFVQLYWQVNSQTFHQDEFTFKSFKFEKAISYTPTFYEQANLTQFQVTTTSSLYNLSCTHPKSDLNIM